MTWQNQLDNWTSLSRQTAAARNTFKHRTRKRTHQFISKGSIFNGGLYGADSSLLHTLWYTAHSIEAWESTSCCSHANQRTECAHHKPFVTMPHSCIIHIWDFSVIFVAHSCHNKSWWPVWNHTAGVVRMKFEKSTRYLSGVCMGGRCSWRWVISVEDFNNQQQNLISSDFTLCHRTPWTQMNGDMK